MTTTTTHCTTCNKLVEKPCSTKKQKEGCLFNKLQPIDNVKPVKGDPDYKKSN